MFEKQIATQNCYGTTVNLKGEFRLRCDDNDAVFEGNVDNNGTPHGFCRVINPNGDVDFFGCFLHGKLIGNCWKSLLGGKICLNLDTDIKDDNFTTTVLAAPLGRSDHFSLSDFKI